MIDRRSTGLAAASCFLGALLLEPPAPAALRESAQWLLRPAVLPFAWRDLQEATRSGDGAEAFARAQQILHLLPSWTDAQIVFAFRFATGDGAALAPAAAAEAARERLRVALAWLESARRTAGAREVELLQAMALLPEIAVGQQPGLEALLSAEGGAAGLADRYLASAERISASAAVREQRTFLTPTVAAGLLAIDDRRGAIAVLEAGIARSADVRDAATATQWAERLREVVRFLRGEEVDLAAVAADPRMAPLLPHLD